MTVEIELLESRGSWQSIVTTLDSYGFEVSGQEEVQLYLSNHPDMLDPTFQICLGLRHEFGNAASLTLELYRDPEFDASHLIVYVRLPHYPSDIMGRIDSVVDKCIGLIDTSGSILVTTDFRPIR